MKTIKAVLLDDEEMALETMSIYLSELPHIEVVATASTLEKAEKEILFHKPALLFLDIRIHGKTVFSMLQKLEKRKMDFSIIFTTAYYKEYLAEAMKSCELKYKNAYLGKPIDKDKLFQLLEPFSESTNPFLSNNKISFKNNQGFVRLDFQEIIYCEADQNYAVIYTTDHRKIIVSDNLKAVTQQLPDHLFFRLSNQHTINISYLRQAKRCNRNKNNGFASTYVAILKPNDKEIKLAIPQKKWKIVNALFSKQY